MKVLFEDARVCLGYDTNVPCLYWRSLGVMDGGQFRGYVTQLLALAVQYRLQYPVTGWLIDADQATGKPPPDIQWMLTVGLQQLSALGITRIAFVMPDNADALLMIDDFAIRAQGHGLSIRLFATADFARQWLRQGN